MSDSLHTRQTLIEKVKICRDDQSWEDFVFYYKSYIFAVIQGMNLSNQDAEDLSQRTLLKLWKSLPDFEYRPGVCKFRTWLCTVIRNEVISWIRTTQKRSKRLEQYKEESIPATFSLPDIETVAEQEWKTHIGKLAWNNIKGSFTDNVINAFLMFSEGKTTAEIAATLKVETNTVNVYKKRVRAKLLKEIKILDNELG